MGGSASKPQPTESDTSASVETTTTPPPQEEESASKCPMHQGNGSYSFDWRQLFKAAAVHGPKGSKPLSPEQQEQAKRAMQNKEGPTSSGGCPVQHKTPPQPESGGCPVRGEDGPYPEYNVYSQPIDKTNQMPKGVKTQLPVATQKSELSVDRVKSTIPKGGADSSETTWTYPSPQQFYNALTRKGKLGDDASEEDMDSVVALHNNMNEKTWAKVVEWEKQTYSESSTPKLLKFIGRPHDLSPKATLKHYLLGHPLPYDRHDWTVLRDDGTTVRYVIDYYYDETRAQETAESAKPILHDRHATPSLLVDVRPALDGPSAFASRAVQMPYKLWSNQTTFAPVPLRGTSEMANQVKESIKVWESIQQAKKQQDQQDMAISDVKISASQAKDIAKSFAKALRECKRQERSVDECDSEEECSKASMDLTMCMGPIFCPVQHKSLVETLQADDDLKIEAALTTLTECVVLQTAQRQLAKQQHPSLFKD